MRHPIEYYETPICPHFYLVIGHDLEDAAHCGAEHVTMRDRIDNRGRINHTGVHSEDYVNGQEPVQESIYVDVTNTMADLLVDAGDQYKGFKLTEPEFVICDSDGKPIYEPRILVKFKVEASD